MRAYFVTLANYNRWANEQIYDAAASLPAEAYFRDRAAFFGSIHGTLNHVLVGDRIWLHRLTGGRGPRPQRLDEILYDNLDELHAARQDEDARIIAVVSGFADAELPAPFRYANMAGTPQEKPLAVVLGHFFNHQTHHRGQVHDMLSQAGIEPPPLDLIYFPGLASSAPSYS